MKPRFGTKKIPTSKGAGTDPKTFTAMPFIDRTAENEAKRQDDFDAVTGNSYKTINGHKRMAGMP
jgi:hypothetical protein